MVVRVSSRGALSVSRWCRLLLLALLSAFFLPAQPAQPVGSLPVGMPEEQLPELKAILTRALQQAPAAQLANLALARGEAEYLVSRSRLLPVVRANASYNINRTEREDQPLAQSDSDGFFYTVGLEQPLFHWGALKAERDIGALELLIRQHNVAEAKRRLAATLRSQYLGLIIQKMTLGHQRYLDELSARSAELQEEQWSRGAMSETQILSVRIDREEAAYTLARREHEFESALRVFGQIAGEPDFDASRVADAFPAPVYSRDLVNEHFGRITSAVIRDLPVSEPLELRLAQAEKRYHIERTRLLPKVGLGANYGLTNLTTATGANIEQTGVVSTTIGVGVNWTIFDGFASRGGRLAALAARRVSEREYETHLESTLNELRRLQREIELAGRALDINERRFDLAREALRQAREDLAAGRVAQGSVDAAIRGTQTWEYHTAQSRLQFFSRWSEYVSLAGLDPFSPAPRLMER